MRTTVTLDPDVERLLAGAMRERSLSFKAALNQAVRDGLARGRQTRAKRFVHKAYAMGALPGINVDKALALADALEDDEIVRKMALRK